MSKNIIVLVSMLLIIAQLGWGDKFIIRGIYENEANMIFHVQDGFSVIDTSTGLPVVITMQGDETYAINSAFGLGGEYEFNKSIFPFALSLGYDFLPQRTIKTLSYDYNLSDSYGGKANLSDKVTVEDAKYQVSYLFTKLKYYFNENIYCGAVLRQTNLALSGKYWDGFKYNSQYSSGLIAGVCIDDFLAEIISAQNSINIEGNKYYTSAENIPAFMFSLGYLFNTSKKDPVYNISQPEKFIEAPQENTLVTEISAVTANGDVSPNITQ